MALLLTTTGTQTPVTIDDLNGRSFTHPTTDFDLLTEFSLQEVADSTDLISAISAGYITVTSTYDKVVTSSADLLMPPAIDLGTVADNNTGTFNPSTMNNAALEQTITNATVPLFYAYDAAGDIDISSGLTDITLDTEVKKDSEFTHSNDSAEIEINTTDLYEITYYIGTYVTSGSSRSDSIAKLQKDTGGGYADIPGTIGPMYNRQSSQGYANACVTVLHTLNDGDKIKLVAQRNSGTNTILTLANSAGLVIRKADRGGPQGPVGVQGPQGPGVGDTGPQGVQGPQGPQGDEGTDGSQGPVGPQGNEGIAGPQGVQGPQGPGVGDTGPQGAQGPQGTAGGLGEVAHNSDATESTTTSTDWVQKLRLTTGTLSGGTYRIGWTYRWNYSNAGNDFRGQIEIDDTTQIMEHRQEAKDPGSDQAYWCSGFVYVDLTSGVKNIDLDYCSANASYTARIRDVHLEIWKV